MKTIVVPLILSLIPFMGVLAEDFCKMNMENHTDFECSTDEIVSLALTIRAADGSFDLRDYVRRDREYIITFYTDRECACNVSIANGTLLSGTCQDTGPFGSGRTTSWRVKTKPSGGGTFRFSVIEGCSDGNYGTTYSLIRSIL